MDKIKNNILPKIEKLYTDGIKQYGATPKAVGWKSMDDHNLRFEKLTSFIRDIKAEISINDYGCGYCALLEYLENKGIKVNTYNGYDISQAMLEVAKHKLSFFRARVNLINSSEITTEADYSFVSGTFNVKLDTPEREWEDFIKKILQQLNKFSLKGFAFNMLSTYVDYKEPHLYYGDPLFWFDYCKRNLARYVQLLHDYPLWEWTIIVKKED